MRQRQLIGGKVKSSEWVGTKFRAMIATIFVMALVLRLYGTDWDQGFHLHPDERMLMIVAQRVNFFDRLDPDFFNYGSLPVYVLSGSAELLDALFGTSFDTYDGMLYLGRIISTLVDMGVWMMVGLTAYELWGKKPRRVIAALGIYGLLFFPIQNSNFYIVDNFMVLFLCVLFWSILKAVQKPDKSWVILAGVMFGAALATKVTPIIFLPWVVFGLGLKYTKEQIGLERLIRWLERVGWWTLASITTFALTMPYALLRWEKFVGDIRLQMQMNADAYVFPYTLQYVGMTPYVYYVKQIFYWGAGPVAAGLSLVGVMWLAYRLARMPAKRWGGRDLLVAVYLIMHIYYFGLIGRSAVKFMRYMLPIYPMMAVCAGYGLVKISDRIKRVHWRWAFTGGVVVMLIAWTWGFMQIYTEPHTRVKASLWIRENIPFNSVLAVEHWDDRLPLFGSEKYRYEELELYNIPDGEQKWRVIEAQLIRADYIVLASNRLYVPLQRLDDCEKYNKCYPMTAEYYRRLFSGDLGFKLVADITNYPKLLGIEIDDDNADESFSVYDHPRVMIFKKDAELNGYWENYRDKLTD